MNDITWTQVKDNVWQTNSLNNGLYGHVLMETAEDGVVEYWAHTYIDNIPGGPHETGEVWLELKDAQKDAEEHLAMEWSDIPSP